MWFSSTSSYSSHASQRTIDKSWLIIDPQPADVLCEHLKGLVDHETGELASSTHTKTTPGRYYAAGSVAGGTG